MDNKQLLIAALNELNEMHILGKDAEKIANVKAIITKVVNEYPAFQHIEPKEQDAGTK